MHVLFPASSAETKVPGCWFQKLACETLDKLFDALVFSSVCGDNNTSLTVMIKLIIVYKALTTLGIQVSHMCLLLLLYSPAHNCLRNGFLKNSRTMFAMQLVSYPFDFPTINK